MTNNQYIKEIETNLQNLISLIMNKYEILKEQSKNITSLYQLNKQIDEIADLIENILYYKKTLEQSNRFDPQFIKRFTPLSNEEIALFNHNRMTTEKIITEHQINIIDKAIAEIKKETKLYRLVSKLEMKRLKLTEELINIKSKLRIFEEEPDLTDGEIDIYLKRIEEGHCFEGLIYLHNSGIEIGEIDYRGPENNEYLGDIGYTIIKDYQGHNYALKALKLISSEILNKGIEKATITTFQDNIASKRTIEKFGGTLKKSLPNNILLYECDLKLILSQSEERNIKK